MPNPDQAPSPPTVVRWLPGDRSTGVPATRVRCRLPARFLRQAGADSRLVRRREDPVPGCDVLVVQDPRDADDAATAQRAAEHGVAVVVDLSDPDRARTDVARRAVEAAGVVTVRRGGLEKLIDHDVTLTVDDAVEWTHPSPPVLRRPRPPEPARLVWFGVGGGSSTGTGLAELGLLYPTLEAMARRRRLEVVVVTDDRARAARDGREAGVPARAVDWSPWRLRSVLAASHACLLPAGPVDAARVRSANRAITALVQGVPVVAGPVPAYEALGGAVLFGSWATNIDRLLADQTLVEHLVGRGREAIRGRYGDATITGQWRAVIDVAVARHDTVVSA